MDDDDEIFLLESMGLNLTNTITSIIFYFFDIELL